MSVASRVKSENLNWLYFLVSGGKHQILVKEGINKSHATLKYMIFNYKNETFHSDNSIIGSSRGDF